MLWPQKFILTARVIYLLIKEASQLKQNIFADYSKAAPNKPELKNALRLILFGGVLLLYYITGELI
jgi:hypothetical protein